MTSKIFYTAIASTSFALMAAMRTPPSPQHDHGKNSADVCTTANFTNSVAVDGVAFETLSNPEQAEGCIRVWANGKIVFQRKIVYASTFTFGQRATDDGSIAAIRNGTNLTGRDAPDMLISAWSGGTHCCRTDFVFETRPVKLLGVIDARDAYESHFAKLDNGRYYYLSADYVFAHWYGPFAGSPVEPVILEYRNDKNGGDFHLALEKMRQPAPTQQEWDKALAKVNNDLALKRANMANDMRTDLWSEVLHLIYTGDSDLAWKFLRDTGEEARTPPDPDLSDFCSTLKASDYWNDLAPSIDMPTACKKVRPDRR